MSFTQQLASEKAAAPPPGPAGKAAQSINVRRAVVLAGWAHASLRESGKALNSKDPHLNRFLFACRALDKLMSLWSCQTHTQRH